MQQLLASLHPPSPPTAREGQQLLTVLQTSFQKRLDEQHPNPSRGRCDPHDKHDVPIARESASSYATANYLGSILSHPAIGVANPLKTEQDVINSFEQLLSEDKLTPATLVLLVKRYMLARRHGKAETGASFGDRLDIWMHSTDQSTRKTFLLDRHFLNNATAMLVNEMNEAVLWKWLRLVYERKLVDASLKDRWWLSVEDRLVSTIMRVAIRRGHLEDAALQFIQACQYRVDSGRGSPSFLAAKFNASNHDSMVTSAMVLASAIIYRRHQHGIPADLFATLPQFLLGWSHKAGPEFSHTFCNIYNPVKPDAKGLFNHLKKEAQAQILIDRQATASATSRKSVMTALLDASEVALDQGHRHEASFLLEFAIDHYPDYLPPRETRRVEDQLEMSFNFAPG